MGVGGGEEDLLLDARPLPAERVALYKDKEMSDWGTKNKI